jgi:sporulation protein YlmC with PRC-barrel domain
MPNNQFEDSRISNGTMGAGAQHVSNLPDTPGAAQVYAEGEGVRDTARTDSYTNRDDGPQSRRVMGATVLAGGRVRNTQGDDLGKIDEIVIDLASSRVAYAVLSFGGFLGIGDKLFAVPWSALKIDQPAHEFILDVSRETLENAPGFDKDEWPDMADPAYGKAISEHYGTAPYWEGK